MFQVYADGAKLYDSGVMNGASATKTVDIDVSGKNELQLVVADAGDGISSDHADWAAAWVNCGQSGEPSPPQSPAYLSDLTWSSMTNGWGPVEKDRSNAGKSSGDGRTITLNGVTYAKASVRMLPRTCATTSGACARASAPTSASTRLPRAERSFQVYADGAKLYDSGVMNGASATKTVDIDVSGKTQLHLVVADAGDGINSDHADWAAARVECTSGTQNTAPTVTIATPTSDQTQTWSVGQTISFAGSATDAEDGTLPLLLSPGR